MQFHFVYSGPVPQDEEHRKEVRRIILYNSTSHHTIPYHTTPHHTTPHYTTLHHATQRYITLHHATLHHNTPKNKHTVAEDDLPLVRCEVDIKGACRNSDIEDAGGLMLHLILPPYLGGIVEGMVWS